MAKKEYKVSAWETVGGYMIVEADNEEEAEAYVEGLLDFHGSSKLDDVSHREVQICGCEEQ